MFIVFTSAEVAHRRLHSAETLTIGRLIVRISVSVALKLPLHDYLVIHCRVIICLSLWPSEHHCPNGMYM